MHTLHAKECFTDNMPLCKLSKPLTSPYSVHSCVNVQVVDLRQLLAVLDLSRSGLKSSLVDRAWEAVKRDLVSTWRTEPSGCASANCQVFCPVLSTWGPIKPETTIVQAGGQHGKYSV